MDDFRISIYSEDFEDLERKYGDKLVRKAAILIDTYTRRIQRDARRIITDEGYRDTGQLITSIKPSVKAYASKITGVVNSGTKYARFIHEGAEHKNESEIVSHFVPFSAAPTLLKWAKRHKKIQYIRGDWYYADKNNQMYLISNLDKGGMMVYTRPTKFFERPFEAVKEQFVKDMSALVGGL